MPRTKAKSARQAVATPRLPPPPLPPAAPLPAWYSCAATDKRDETRYAQVQNVLAYHLVEEIEAGDIMLPAFQRAPAWTRDQQIELLETMVRGLPVGTLLFWEPPHGQPQPASIPFPNLDNANETSKWHKGHPLLLLDGQQRVLALLAAKRGELGVRWDGQRWGDTGYLDAAMCFDFLDFDHSASLREHAGDEVWLSALRAHEAVLRSEIQIVKITGTEAQARDAYRRMNSTGTRHTPADLERAK